MTKSGAKPRAVHARTGAVTKKKIVAAALKTLKRDGFSGASARVIARTGRFNPALIFYHFGGLHELLLAALDETSRVRMAKYQELVASADSLPLLIEKAAEMYREDLRSGHITVLVEMIAGAASVPELGPEIAERIVPWVEMTEEILRRVVGDTFMAQLASPSEIAFAIVSLYLGMEMMTHLTQDPSRAESAFAVASNLARLVSGLQEPA